MRGGRRPGAGRKPGSANKRTREIATKAAASGITPLEVMVQAMREQWELYLKEKTPQRAEAAVRAAQLAAPYMHPRLESIEQYVDAKVRHFAVSSEPLDDEEWQKTYGPLGTPGRTPKSAH